MTTTINTTRPASSGPSLDDQMVAGKLDAEAKKTPAAPQQTKAAGPKEQVIGREKSAAGIEQKGEAKTTLFALDEVAKTPEQAIAAIAMLAQGEIRVRDDGAVREGSTAAVLFEQLSTTIDPQRVPDVETLASAFAPDLSAMGLPSLIIDSPKTTTIVGALRLLDSHPTLTSPNPATQKRIELIKAYQKVCDADVAKGESKQVAAALVHNVPAALLKKVESLAPQLAAAYKGWLGTKSEFEKKLDRKKLTDEAIIHGELPVIPGQVIVEMEKQAQRMLGSDSGIDPALLMSGDIESLLTLVMMECEKTDTSILRDQIKEMDRINQQKKATREKITKMKSEQADVEKTMHAEFETFQSKGGIAPDVTFDQYKSWRQVTWTPEGEAAVSQPLPELPDSLIFGASGPPDASVAGETTATGDSQFPVPASMGASVKQLADKYGITEQDAAYLYSYYAFVATNGSKALNVRPGQIVEGGPSTAQNFDQFLGLMLHLNASDPAGNPAKVDALFADTIAKDTGVVPESTEAKLPPPPDKRPKNKKPATEADYNLYVQQLTNWYNSAGSSTDINGNDRPVLVKTLYTLLQEEPFKGDNAVQRALVELIEVTSNDTGLEGFTEAMCEGTDFDFTDGEDEAHAMKKLIDAVQHAAPGSQAVAMLTAFVHVADQVGEGDEDTKKILRSASVTTFNIADKLGDAKKTWNKPGHDDKKDAPKAGPPSSSELGKHWAAAREAKANGDAARAKAEKAVKAARDAASDGHSAIGSGEKLEGLPGSRMGSADQFGVEIDKLTDSMASMGELSETESLRLQGMMDRRAKIIETLSNILKKLSQTDSTISGNQK